jgi:hypothetical protein
VERRLALTYSVSAAATLVAGSFAIAALGGGLFAGATPRTSVDGMRIETVDDYVVVHSSITVATDMATIAVGPGPAPGSETSAGSAAPTGNAQSVGPLPTPTQPPTGTAEGPGPDSPATVPPIASLDPIQPPTPEAAPEGTPAPALAPVPPASAPAASTPPSTVAAPQPPPTVAPSIPAAPSGARIPSDWPADKPIPPIPAGCGQPQLEDNGVWNCQ